MFDFLDVGGLLDKRKHVSIKLEGCVIFTPFDQPDARGDVPIPRRKTGAS